MPLAFPFSWSAAAVDCRIPGRSSRRIAREGCLTELADRERVVIAYCGRIEHFARTGQTRRLADGEVPLFRWTYGTVMAE